LARPPGSHPGGQRFESAALHLTGRCLNLPRTRESEGASDSTAIDLDLFDHDRQQCLSAAVVSWLAGRARNGGPYDADSVGGERFGLVRARGNPQLLFNRTDQLSYTGHFAFWDGDNYTGAR
jgi:hypothetical protein